MALNFGSPAGMRMRSLLITVGSVVMSLSQNLSPLGTKNASIALFAGMSISCFRINMSKHAPMAFKDGYRDRFFVFFI